MVYVNPSIESLRSLSQIFTNSNLKRIVEKKYSFTDYRIKRHTDARKGMAKSEVISQVYKTLQEHYKGEYFYKNALLNKIAIVLILKASGILMFTQNFPP